MVYPKGTTFTALHKKRIGDALRGKPKSVEARRNMSLAKRGITPHNKGKSKENYLPLLRVSEKLSGMKKSSAHRRKLSLSKRALMRDPAYKARFVQRLMSSWAKRPNGSEKRVIDACVGLPLKYTGDGSFMIGYKNPDFLVIGQKKVVEVMCMFFHDRKLNPTIRSHRTVKSTLGYYKKKGYDCLIINHKSTYFTDWVRRTVEKFIGGDFPVMGKRGDCK